MNKIKQKQQVILNPKYPGEICHLKYYGQKAINNVFVMTALKNIKVLKGDYNYIDIKDCKDYTVTEGRYKKDEELDERIIIIEWEFDPTNPINCLH